MKLDTNTLKNHPESITMFNVNDIKLHVVNLTVPDEAVKNLDAVLDQVTEKYKLSPDQVIDLIIKMLVANIMQYYKVEHIAPKTFMIGLTILKAGVEFVNNMSMVNTFLSDRQNVKVLSQRIDNMLKDTSLKYNDVPKILTQAKNAALAN